MTGPAPAQSCRVSLLVPHPRRLAVLVADDDPSGPSGASATPRLPTLLMSGAGAEPARHPGPRRRRRHRVDGGAAARRDLGLRARAPGGVRRRRERPTDRLGLARPGPRCAGRAGAGDLAGGRGLLGPRARRGLVTPTPAVVAPRVVGPRLDLDARADGRRRPPGARRPPGPPALGALGRPAGLVVRRRRLPQVQRRPLPARGDRDPGPGRTDAGARTGGHGRRGRRGLDADARPRGRRAG